MKPNLYGVSEVAEALAVTPAQVSAWNRDGTHGIPEPDYRPRCGPLWLPKTIEPWMAHHRTHLHHQEGP